MEKTNAIVTALESDALTLDVKVKVLNTFFAKAEMLELVYPVERYDEYLTEDGHTPNKRLGCNKRPASYFRYTRRGDIDFMSDVDVNAFYQSYVKVMAKTIDIVWPEWAEAILTGRGFAN